MDSKVTIDDFYNHIHPADRERTRDAIARSIESHGPYDIEYRTIDPKNPKNLKLIRALGWTDYAEDGTPIRFDGITLDQTLKQQQEAEKAELRAERVLAVNKLRESEMRYEMLTSSIPQLVWTCLPNGQCDYLSQQWAEYTGIPAEIQLGLDWLTKVIHPDDRERTLAHWMGAVRGEHRYDIGYRIRRSDGEYRWFQTRGTPMLNENGEIVLLGRYVYRHPRSKLIVDELNAARIEAERASEAKTQFLANMSHEIRTPIGAITGFTDLLKSPTSSESDKQTYTMIIERNSKHLLRLIDDILDVSKVEAGKIAFEQIEFSLPEFLKDFETVMTQKANDKGIEFNITVAGRIPNSVAGDQLRIRQILSNVVGNALKFTERGFVSVRASYDNSILRFEITDSGIGISVEDAAHLFKPFSQADPSLTRKFGGTGLGLVLSKRLASLLGGNLVLARSEKGQGSTFVATIQLASAPDAKWVDFDRFVQNAAAVPSSEKSSPDLNQLKILLVEDSSDNQTLIANYLRKTGAILDIAGDGMEGIERAEEFKPDVILMDIQMPRMDGHEAMKQLRQKVLRARSSR